MKRSTPVVRTNFGTVEFLKVNTGQWAWRDMYHWMLTLNWPQFSVFLSSVYLGVNMVFAALYVSAGAGGVAEMPAGSFLRAFFFSVETLATVGYGHMYPVSVYAHFIATAEIIVGMFGMAVVTGLIFVRFSRPAASLRFSSRIVVTPFNGVPTLMLRVANQRHQPMVEAEFRLMFTRIENTLEGDEVARFYPLQLQFDRIITFPAALTVRHVVDESSPIYGATPEILESWKARFTASVVCVDTVVAASVQSRQHYSWHDVRFGERFVEIYTEAGAGRYVVDYGRLHDTEIPPATITAEAS
jgi:inward rectifier potassium channel